MSQFSTFIKTNACSTTRSGANRQCFGHPKAYLKALNSFQLSSTFKNKGAYCHRPARWTRLAAEVFQAEAELWNCGKKMFIKLAKILPLLCRWEKPRNFDSRKV